MKSLNHVTLESGNFVMSFLTEGHQLYCLPHFKQIAISPHLHNILINKHKYTMGRA